MQRQIHRKRSLNDDKRLLLFKYAETDYKYAKTDYKYARTVRS